MPSFFFFFAAFVGSTAASGNDSVHFPTGTFETALFGSAQACISWRWLRLEINAPRCVGARTLLTAPPRRHFCTGVYRRLRMTKWAHTASTSTTQRSRLQQRTERKGQTLRCAWRSPILARAEDEELGWHPLVWRPLCVCARARECVCCCKLLRRLTCTIVLAGWCTFTASKERLRLHDHYQCLCVCWGRKEGAKMSAWERNAITRDPQLGYSRGCVKDWNDPNVKNKIK